MSNFIDNGLIDPNPPEIDATYLKSGGWNKFLIDFFTINGKSYGLPLLEGSRACLYWNKTYFNEAWGSLDCRRRHSPELIDAAEEADEESTARDE